jgi:hypothetical protein
LSVTLPPVEPDHLVVAARTLRDGCAWIENRLGLAPLPGGKHVAMGTHNALLSLGPGFYLEVIAVDPEGKPPPRPRWFDLDDPGLRADLAEGPQLIHWAARTGDIDSACRRVPELGPHMPMARGAYRWRIAVPDDGHRPGRGLVPTVIEWSGGKHPAEQLPDAGLRLIALAGEHPDPASVRTLLERLGLAGYMRVTSGRTPRMVAMIRTPLGTVML